ncbi:MAG: hypothetical protein ABMB14_18825 [Myxococcota bacterium]
MNVCSVKTIARRIATPIRQNLSAVGVGSFLPPFRRSSPNGLDPGCAEIRRSRRLFVRFTLARWNIDVDTKDAAEPRTWLMERVRQEVKLKGEPHPKLILLFTDHEEVFDLDAMAKKDRGASGGATFQALRSRPGIRRRFVVLRMETTDDEGKDHVFAMLFEELDAAEGKRRWWMALLPFTTDPVTGLGNPDADWQPCSGETDDPRQLPAFLHEYVAPPADARPAAFDPPPAMLQPDIKFAFGELPPGAPVPTNPKQLVEFAFHLAARELLTGAVQGTVIVRIADRSWEQWIVGNDVPTSNEDMARYIANVREPVADGIAMVIVAIRPNDEPPQPGIQVVGEMGGYWAELWGPIEFPQGPAGPKQVTRLSWWDPKPVPAAGMFLHVRPKIEFVPSPTDPEA